MNEFGLIVVAGLHPHVYMQQIKKRWYPSISIYSIRVCNHVPVEDSCRRNPASGKTWTW